MVDHCPEQQYQLLLSGSIPDELDVLQLASPSEEESDSDTLATSDSEGEWVMAGDSQTKARELAFSGEGGDGMEPAARLQVSSEDIAAGKGRGKARQQRQRRKHTDSDNVFAPAEEYADLIKSDRPVKRSKRKSSKG